MPGHRADVLRGIMREFDSLDEECPVDDQDSDDEALNLSQGRDRRDHGKGKGKRARQVQRTSDQLRRVEGTVLSHFNFAAKQDLTLGRDMVGSMRGVAAAWPAMSLTRARLPCTCCSPVEALQARRAADAVSGGPPAVPGSHTTL